ncbi:hypothetical protein [Terracidiphilus gabretensis]|jgi:hypothetical protein|uniref:hypothetical protein n=1 Tax=Terracidiphilus gabretensis TaxID=1577687 RepID=UPI00071B7D7F|nr:hypothetical protein [Terracidiphilus gabretensis]
MRTRFFAIASGFILGGLLYAGYWEIMLLERRWQYGAIFVLLTALGLGWLFPRHWRSAASTTVLSPFLLASPFLGFVLFMGWADSGALSALGGLGEWLGLFALILAGALLSAWIGSRIARRLSGSRAARFLGLVPIVAVFGAVTAIAYTRWVHQADLKRHESELKRDAIKEVPDLMHRVYQAEIAYSAGQPDKAFTCDGRQLSKIPGLDWTFNPNSYSYYQIEPYTIGLYCAQESRPHGFCLTAFPWDRTHPGPAFWMDEKGKLVEGDTAKANPETVCPVS